MKYFGFLIIAIFATSNLYAQIDSLVTKTTPHEPDSLYLNIVIPEEDTVTYSASRYRVAANTHPNANAFINGKEVKVYGSGAFVDMVLHPADTTAIEFVVTMNGDTLKENRYLVKPKPPTKMLFDGKVITDRMVIPAEDVWLKSGEELKVQFLGTPGQDVVFNIDYFKDNIPMKEVPVEQTGGVEGVYRGSYKVKPGDKIYQRNVTFKMKKNLFSYHKKTSDFTVSFNGVPRTAVVSDERAYLNIGMGTDRLGGARFGNIEEGVKLNITGKKNRNYRVRLSESLDAWIPERFVELLDQQNLEAESLTGSIRIREGNDEDVITLNLSEKLAYISYQEIDPNKIIVDVFGATSNTNWKTKMLNSRGIDKVEWQQVENGRFRIIISLNHSQNWGYSVGYGWGSQLEIKVRRPPVITSLKKPLEGRTITVDAGHGGDSKGALGAAGFEEKEVTLQIARKLKSLLVEEGVDVIMTRSDDSNVYMSDRHDMSLKNKSDLLVSIHANSIGYGSNPEEIQGTGVFYKHMAYRPLAEKMYHKMLELDFRDYGLTGSFNFSLNAPIEYPNVLVETAFISNPEEEMHLINPEYQTRIAQQIVKGLKEFYLQHSFIETVSDMPEK